MGAIKMSIKYACYLPVNSQTGWGRCSKEVRWHLSGKGVYCNHSQHPHTVSLGSEVMLSALSDHTFQYTSNVMGMKNVGYGFIENNIVAPGMSYYANRLWDYIVCGSTWMREWLESHLDVPCSVAIQGVNPDQFNYRQHLLDSQKIGFPNGKDVFVVGSFGKFELRKSQDVVIQAMAIFQEKYPDTCLLYNWHNEWPVYMRNFAWNPHSKIKMMYSLDNEWYKQNESMFFKHTLESNKVKSSVNANQYWMDVAYRNCDVALFPNRCEAGTNLCLMEALACGIPCIATHATGHTDITGSEFYPCKDLLLKNGKLKTFYQGQEPLGEWHEPDVDEVVSMLELAYKKRDELKANRQLIALLSRKEWSHTADRLYEAMEYAASNL